MGEQTLELQVVVPAGWRPGEVVSISDPYGHMHDVRVPRGASEKDARLAQKLGQLQPFLAALPQEWNVRANSHLLSQPNIFLAAVPGRRIEFTVPLHASMAGGKPAVLRRYQAGRGAENVVPKELRKAGPPRLYPPPAAMLADARGNPRALTENLAHAVHEARESPDPPKIIEVELGLGRIFALC